MREIKPPKEIDYSTFSLFLAGSISKAWDWQKYIVDSLSRNNSELNIFNPRRDDFDVENVNMQKEQIQWEFEALAAASMISFYFSHETVAPITLYELGVHSRSNKPIFVCVHPDYPRRLDVETQLSLSRPDITIVYSLNDLIEQILGHTL